MWFKLLIVILLMILIMLGIVFYVNTQQSNSVASKVFVEENANNSFKKSLPILWKLNINFPIINMDASLHGEYIIVSGNISENYVLCLLGKNRTILWNITFSNPIYDIAISENGSYIVIASDHIYLLNQNGEIIWKSEESFGRCSIYISRNGKYIIVGSYSSGWTYLLNSYGEVLWSRKLFTRKPLGYITSTSFLDDKKYVIVGDDKGYVFLINEEGNYVLSKKILSFNKVCRTYVATNYNNSLIGIGISIFQNKGYIAILSVNGSWILKPKEINHGIDKIIVINGLFIQFSNRIYVYNCKGELIDTYVFENKIADICYVQNRTLVVGLENGYLIYLSV